MANPTLQIPSDVINPIIEAQISAAIAQALGQPGALIERAIRTILATKVNSNGEVSSYGANQTWFDWAVASQVKKAAQAAIEANVAALGDAMKKQFITELSKKNSPMVKQIVDGMVSGVFKPENLKYRLTVVAEER